MLVSDSHFLETKIPQTFPGCIKKRDPFQIEISGNVLQYFDMANYPFPPEAMLVVRED
jgi:hypothetical protein